MKIPIAFSPITSPTTIKLASGQPYLASWPCPTIRGAQQSKAEALRQELLSLKPGEMLPRFLEYHEAAYRAADMLGITVRTMRDKAAKGVRVWRVR